MLVLAMDTRTKSGDDEIILVKDGVIVGRILSMPKQRHTQFKLGFELPKDVRVYRRKVWEKMQSEGNSNEDSVCSSPDV